MNKIIAMIFIALPCSIYAANNQFTGKQQPISKTKVIQTTKKIIDQEKKENECILADTEIKNIFRYFLRKKDISLSSFSGAKLSGTKIIDGLYMVVKDKKTPQQVYKLLNMAKHGISEETWEGYTKKYKDVKSIDKLKRYVPDNMDIIIETGKKSFASQLENWLLLKKIIIDFDAKFPQNKNYTPAKKEKEWWGITLKKYGLAPDLYDNVLRNITLMHSLSNEDQTIIKKYFKNQEHKIE